MKTSILILVASFTISATTWLTDFNNAKKIAAEKHQLILLNFSGSDWCGPCMRLKKEIFESAFFESFADSNLVLVNADFPRNKKNQLPKEQETQNEKLADEYNPNGQFPLTLLLNANGKIIKTWDGFPNMKPEDFVLQIKQIYHAN